MILKSLILTVEEMKGEEAIEDFKNKFVSNVVITMREKDTKLKSTMTEIGNIYVASM